MLIVCLTYNNNFYFRVSTFFCQHKWQNQYFERCFFSSCFFHLNFFYLNFLHLKFTSFFSFEISSFRIRNFSKRFFNTILQFEIWFQIDVQYVFFRFKRIFINLKQMIFYRKFRNQYWRIRKIYRTNRKIFRSTFKFMKKNFQNAKKWFHRQNDEKTINNRFFCVFWTTFKHEICNSIASLIRSIHQKQSWTKKKQICRIWNKIFCINTSIFST